MGCAQQLHVQGCRRKAFRGDCSECAEETVREGFLEEAALNGALKGKKDSVEQIRGTTWADTEGGTLGTYGLSYFFKKHF